MDHAEAHERLLDLALEPGGPDGIADDDSVEARALRGHLASCDRCRADLASWQTTQDTLRTALTEDGASDDARIPAPGSLRSAIASIPSTEAARSAPVTLPAADVADRAGPRRGGPILAWAVAAGLVVAIGASLVAVGQAQQAGASQQAAGDMLALARAMSDVLGDPDHMTVSLHGADGDEAGLAAWSPTGYVILSRALPPPPSGSEYRCWFEVDGARTPIGTMRMTGDLAYWWGAATPDRDGWSGGAPTIGVSLEPIGSGGGGPAVLTSAAI